jgi:hypothetical protein
MWLPPLRALRSAYKVLLLPVAFGIWSCATYTAPISLNHAVRDDPIGGRLWLSYHNASPYPICVAPEHWPNQAGKINQGSDWVAMIVSGEVFRLADFNTGYCVGGCATRVPPGGTLTGHIEYADFGLPEYLREQPKTLRFTPLGYRCPASR